MIRRAGGVFRQLHDALVGVDIDFDSLDPGAFPPGRVAFAQHVWADRVHSEFRSIQTLNRFVAEVLGAGDPLDVYAGAADAVLDEVRHTALCVEVLTALGGTPTLPEPVHEAQHPEFLAMPMAQRALATAITMLCVNETISTAYIEDLQRRCEQPVIRAVLDATLADEETHEAFGWDYVAASLGRFDGTADAFALSVTEHALRPHLEGARQKLSTMGDHRLSKWPEYGLVELGLSSAERQALVFRQVFNETLAPRLRRLGLLAAEVAL